MKAMARYEYGDSLSLVELDDPAPTGDEVLVRIRAAGVDRGAWHVMTGLPTLARLAFGLRRPRDPKIGMDAAGIVEAVGPDVTLFSPGDEVFGVVRGSFAELALIDEKHLVAKPAGLTFERAAAAPTSANTVLDALRGREGRLLVLGAGGGVGHFAVQLGVASGFDVTAATSDPEFAVSLGAHRVIDYRSEPLAGQFDVILDIGGRRPVSSLRALLEPRGTLVFVGGEGGGALLGGMQRQLVVAPFSGQKFVTFVGRNSPANLRELTGHLEAGTVVPHVDRAYPLAEANAALAHLLAGVRGKLVLTP